MNVLLIGAASELANQLIKKMNKEGHRVSILTGSRYAQGKYERVFERYDFNYTNSVMMEIFESVAPDVTIYLGAYDRNYGWWNAQEDSARFISGLISLLTAYAFFGKGRFFFLSSEAVFTGDGEKKETDRPNANDFKGMAFAQGEALCDSFRLSRDLDIINVRLGGLYGVPRRLEDVDTLPAEFCLTALRDGQVCAHEDCSRTLLHVADAVQFLGQMVAAPVHRHSLYHITGQAVKEEELARFVADAFESQTAEEEEKMHIEVTTVHAASEKDALMRALNCDRFRREFGINRLNETSDIVGQIVRTMLRHKDRFLDNEQAALPWYKRLWMRASWVVQAILPFLENLIAFIPFFLLSNYAAGSQFFAKIDFYLLYVLLFAILFGQQQATFSAILATFGYLFRQMHDRSGFDVLLDYNTYIWIAELFILGLVVGYLKDRINDQRVEMREDHTYMVGQVDDIKEINSSNVRVKDAMQTQIINQSDSVGKIYEITSTLDQYSYDEVLFFATEILGQIMGSDDVAIYTVKGGPYARLFTATSPLARTLGNSMRYVDLPGLYDEISQKHVFINRKLDPSLPKMASAIYDDGEVRLLLLVWTLPWEKMTLGQANILAVTGALIQNAVLHANRYLEALHSDRYIGDTPILRPKEFGSLLRAYRKAEERGLTVYSVLEILPGEQRLENLGGDVKHFIRPNDYVGELVDDRIIILLTNTDKDGCNTVMDRLAQKGFKTEHIYLTGEEEGLYDTAI